MFQQKTKEFIQNLFTQCEFIISGHFWFNWFPAGISTTSSHINIKQKLKSKMYLWIRKISKKWITIKEINMFDWINIVKYDLSKFSEQYWLAIEFIQEELNLLNYNYGFEITVFSECFRWEWVWFTWTIMSLLVSWIYCIIWKLSSDTLRDYKMFEQSQLFKNIKNLSHQATRIVKKWDTGSAFVTALLETTHPHIYICEEVKWMDYKDVVWIQDCYQTLPEVFWEKYPSYDTLPIRRALVYTGQKSNTLFVQWQRKFLENINLEYQSWIEQKKFWEINNSLKSNLDKINYFQTKIQNLNDMSINILYLLEKIYKRGVQNLYIHELIKNMNLINKLYNDIEQDFDITNDFENACAMEHVSPENFWFFPIYTNKYGGNYLVIFEDDSDLRVLENVIHNMKNIYPDIIIREIYDFDDPAKDGLKIEQNIYENLQWGDNRDLYVLIDNYKNQKFVSYSDIDPQKEPGIFCDMVSNKLYVNWQKLTSKELKSASTTIELFEHLLQSKDGKIKNNELWPSSFTSQQNQMLGKIIYPFVKYIKTTLWKDLPLWSVWSLREYYITLWETDIPIKLIKKI